MSKLHNNIKSAARSAARELVQIADKAFGKGTLMLLDGKTTVPAVATFSSGSIFLDQALGVGGLPRGRLIEVFGPESSGKTTLALHAIAEVQRAGGQCAFIDAEHALDVRYAEALGVRLPELLLSQPDNGEQALDVADMLVSSESVALIVVDSVAALVPKTELEGEMGDQQVGLQARLMSKAMRKLAGTTYRTGTSILFINQTRQKIGQMGFGPATTTTGGNALRFYASVRLDIRRIGAVKEGEVSVGNRTRVKVVKNKLAPPFREAEFEIQYGRGVNREAEVIELAMARGRITKSGAWYAMDDKQLGQGRSAACRHLADNPDVRDQLVQDCLAPEVVDTTATVKTSKPAKELPKGGKSKAAA